jgi:flagellar motility protein MotE (MotC chaperone)
MIRRNIHLEQSGASAPVSRVCVGVVGALLLGGGIWLVPQTARSDPPGWQTTVVSPVPSAEIGPPAPGGSPTAAPSVSLMPPIPRWPAPMPTAGDELLKSKAGYPALIPRDPAAVRPLPMPSHGAPKMPRPVMAESPATPVPKIKVEMPPSVAATGAPAVIPPAPIPARRPIMPSGPDSDLAQQYCASVGDIASRTRTEADRRSIADMTEQLDKRIGLLDQKIAEHKSWLAKREEFLASAQGSLVRIFSRMKSEAAAAQLAAMPEISAAAIVAKLEPKAASGVLAEMDPVKAARLTTIMAGAAELAAAAVPPEVGGPIK